VIINNREITTISKKCYSLCRKLTKRIFGVHPTTYIQDFNSIKTNGPIWIGPGAALITRNHCINDLNKHEKHKEIHIGKNSWIGANAIILPGVRLGEHTIVGAGSIVTKSFSEGNCVIGGNPAKIIKKI
jgi:acetyltransferase-like isoleucine patch superfamily enzyme